MSKSPPLLVNKSADSAVADDALFLRSEAIKAEYLASGCQASDVDEAIEKLMAECAPLFGDARFAWSFLMEETHEDMDNDDDDDDDGDGENAEGDGGPCDTEAPVLPSH